MCQEPSGDTSCALAAAVLTEQAIEHEACSQASLTGCTGRAWPAVVVAVGRLPDGGKLIAVLRVLGLGRAALIPEGAVGDTHTEYQLQTRPRVFCA